MDKKREKYDDYSISLNAQTEDKDLVNAIVEVLNVAQVKSVYNAVILNSINLTQIRTNPYILSEKIKGIGFLTADKLGARLGIKNNDPNRIKSGMLYAMQQAESNGDCACKERNLIMSACQLLRVNEDIIKEICNVLVQQNKLIRIIDNDVVFYQSDIMWNAESIVAKRLTEFRMSRCVPFDVSSSHKIKLSQSQRVAIDLIANTNMTIITGGPGTGKTYLIKTILEICSEYGLSTSLLAPTGKAARRIEESTGYPASTIHRALGFNGGVFTQKISSKVVIIDEFSMVDIVLFSKLLSRLVGDNPRIYLVGDPDQLPSVGPGNILTDLIASGDFPTIKLTEIYRQSHKSEIISGAYDVNQGISPQIIGNELKVYRFSSAQHIADAIIETVKFLLLDDSNGMEGTKINLSDVLVISPMKKGYCGTIELNTRLQSLLNPYSKPKNKLGFYKGDRVMQTVNDYDINVMNGSIGTIESIEWNGKSYQISVRFDDNEGAITTIKDFRVFNLILAYAITIHKSQGSEYPYIVMPVTSAHYIMLNRNLVYTGMTRAKTRTYMMIDDSGMTRALSTRLANRLTFLQDRIYEANFDYYSNDTLPNQ